MASEEVEEVNEGERVVVDGVVRGGRRGKGRGRVRVSGRGRMVTGFGSERVEDLRAQEEERGQEGGEGGRVVVGGVLRGEGGGRGRGRGPVAAVRGASERGRVVMGFGSERVEDVRALEEEREQETCQRQRERNEENSRARARDLWGDLDRAEGGAFSWRR